MNSRSKTLKLGKWWLTHIKYIIPAILIMIWIGGMHELMALKTPESIIVLIVLTSILIISSVILTLSPVKSKDWFETEERIK